MTLEEAVPVLGVLVPLLGGVDFLVRKWVTRYRDEMVVALNAQIKALHDRNSELNGNLAATRADCVAAVNRCVATEAELMTANQSVTSLTDTLQVTGAQLAELNEVREKLAKNEKAHDNRINRALKLQGAIWTQKVMTGEPRFVPRAERKTPVVSVLNLKGGVGKTTLTANLAWALSARGYRVLLIDLDLQGSLSSLFLHNEELTRLARTEQRLFQHFLSPAKAKQGDAKPRRSLMDFAVSVPQLNSGCRLIAASDKLAYAELSQTVRWLLRVGGTRTWSGRHDGRMILRRALHRKGVYKRFDVVLMDCPPLLNLCCSNALAASDTVLIPVTPSPKAIERVTPLLRRVVEVRENGVNPKLNVLGVVINRTERVPMTSREEDLFVNLPDSCREVFGAPVYQFDTIIQQRVAIQNTESQFQAPGEDNPLRATFEALAAEFVEQLCLPEPRLRGRRKKGDAAASGGGS